MPISKRQHKANASKGGKVGGPARAKALTKKQRAAIARAGGLAKQAKWRAQQTLKSTANPDEVLVMSGGKAYVFTRKSREVRHG